MVHTAPQDWNTPFGVLEADEEIKDRLLESNMAVVNFDLMENETMTTWTRRFRNKPDHCHE